MVLGILGSEIWLKVVEKYTHEWLCMRDIVCNLQMVVVSGFPLSAFRFHRFNMWCVFVKAVFFSSTIKRSFFYEQINFFELFFVIHVVCWILFLDHCRAIFLWEWLFFIGWITIFINKKDKRNKHRLPLWGTMTISFKAYSRQQIKKRGDENIFLNSLTRKDPFSNIIGNKINFPKCVKLHTK